MARSKQTPRPGIREWLLLKVAAPRLGTSTQALRKQIERAVYRGPDNALWAYIGGLHARKFDGRWKIAKDPMLLA